MNLKTLMTFGNDWQSMDIDLNTDTGLLSFDVDLYRDDSSACFELTKDQMINLRDELNKLNL